MAKHWADEPNPQPKKQKTSSSNALHKPQDGRARDKAIHSTKLIDINNFIVQRSTQEQAEGLQHLQLLWNMYQKLATNDGWTKKSARLKLWAFLKPLQTTDRLQKSILDCRPPVNFIFRGWGGNVHFQQLTYPTLNCGWQKKVIETMTNEMCCN